MARTKPTKGVFVRFDTKTMKTITQLAKDKRWSLASTVAWCVEQQLGTDNVITRRGGKHA